MLTSHKRMFGIGIRPAGATGYSIAARHGYHWGSFGTVVIRRRLKYSRAFRRLEKKSLFAIIRRCKICVILGELLFLQRFLPQLRPINGHLSDPSNDRAYTICMTYLDISRSVHHTPFLRTSSTASALMGSCSALEYRSSPPRMQDNSIGSHQQRPSHINSASQLIIKLEANQNASPPCCGSVGNP